MGSDRHYQQQYGDMYFLRLAKLKPAVEKIAMDAWGELIVRILLTAVDAENAKIWDMS